MASKKPADSIEIELPEPDAAPTAAAIEKEVQRRVAEALEKRAAAETKAIEKQAGKLKHQGYSEILIHLSADRNVKNHKVFVGGQGVPFYLERNAKIIVPNMVVDILRNSITTRYQYNDTTKQNEPYDAPDYPFQIIRESCTEEEYKAQAITFGRTRSAA